MEQWVFIKLLKGLEKYAIEYKIDIFKDNELFFILKDVNYYIIIPKKRFFYFVKVFFVDCTTHEIVEIYKTKTIYYKDALKEIKKIHKNLNYIKIEEY